MLKKTAVVIVSFILLSCLFITHANAQNFLSTSRSIPSLNQNALGFGYFNEPVLYTFTDGSKDNYTSNYSGWMVKYIRYFDTTTAIHVNYVQAHGEEDIRVLSGSAVYGFNLNRPGIGAYIGVSYSLKQRTQFAGTPLAGNEKDHGLDYPIGIQLQNNLLMINFETRYKHFLLDGDNVSADSVWYPLYFSVLVNF